MDFFEVLAVDMRVDLRCRNVSVSKHFLHHAQIRPPFEQVRCEGVAESVRVHRS